MSRPGSHLQEEDLLLLRSIAVYALVVLTHCEVCSQDRAACVLVAVYVDAVSFKVICHCKSIY